MNKPLFLGAAALITASSFAFAGEEKDCQQPPMGMMSTEAMSKMQEQMARMRQTNDPAQRQQLLQEQLQTMKEAVQAKRAAAPAPMQQRMDMMQSMMENMLEHRHQMQQTQ